MNNITTVKDLAMIFYNDLVENSKDTYEPDSKYTKLLGEIEETLSKITDFKTISDLESKIISLSDEDIVHYYCLGFETALDVAKVVFDDKVL